jgi:hypothetical protein
MTAFYQAVKSTLDYTIKSLANSHSLDYIDLDGAFTMEELYASSVPAMAWSLVSFDEAPRAPLYRLEILVGGKTTADPSQYTSAEIISYLQGVFSIGSDLTVKDYTQEDMPTVALGDCYVVGFGVDSALTDGRSGLRLARVFLQVVEF